MGGVHNDETASGRIDHQVARFSDGADQAGDEIDRLHMGMDFSVDFLRPAITDSVVPPGILCSQRRLLYYKQIIAAPARTVTIAGVEDCPTRSDRRT